jgi:hypothetical protein
LARITKAIKGASAHLINRALSRSGTVWQEESFDRVLRCSEKLDEKVEYVLNNRCVEVWCGILTNTSGSGLHP